MSVESVASKMQDMGRAEEKLHMLLEDDIFQKLSKHNPYWESEDEEAASKLDDLRMKFGYIHDRLWDMLTLLRREDS